MIERRLARAAWLLFAGALAASCGGNSVSRIEDGDEAGVGATAGDAGNGGAATTGGVSTGGVTTGGVSTGGVTTGGMTTGGASTGGASGTGARPGGFGGSAGSAQSGSGGAGGTGGEGGDVPCPDMLPSLGACDGDLAGTWTAAACSLTVSGVVDLSGLGFSPACMPAPVTGSLRVTGTVTFDEMTYSDYTTTSGESTFELAPECLVISGTETTCDVLARPLQSLGYDSVTCVSKAVNGGCTCTGTVLQTGGLAFVSYDASSSGSYTTGGNEVTLSSFDGHTEYSYCASQAAQMLTLSLQTVARTGTVADPIVLVKP